MKPISDRQTRRATNDRVISSTSFTAEAKPQLWVGFRLLIVAYLASVVLYSYQDGLQHIAKVLGVMLGVAFIFVAYTSERKISLPLSYRLWLIWFLIAGISTLQADDFRSAYFQLLTLAQVAGIGIILTNLILWNGSARFYWIGLVGAAVASMLMVSADPAAYEVFGRTMGTQGDPNRYGTLLVTVLALALVAAATERGTLVRVLFAVFAVAFFYFVLLTGSRQAMLGALLAGGLFLSTHLVRKAVTGGLKSLVPTTIVAVLVVSSVAIYLVSSDFWFRMENLFYVAQTGDLEGVDEGSLSGRFWFYVRSVELWLRNPALGYGLGNFSFQTLTHLSTQRIGVYSHSNYMEILVSTGLIGFAIYFSIYALWVVRLARNRGLMRDRATSAAYMRVMVVVVTYIVIDLVQVTYYEKVHWLVFPWIIAELELMRRRTPGVGQAQRRFARVKTTSAA